MIISTCSFGSSGSSAVSDYLCECQDVQVMDKLEFTVTSMVDGLSDLEYQLMIKNARQSSSIYAIQRFKKAMMSRVKGYQKRTGISPDRVEALVDEFIENIAQVRYVGFSPRIGKTRSQLFKTYVGDSLIRNRIVRTLEKKGIIKTNIDFYPLDTVHMAIAPENFYDEARSFLKKLLTEMGADFDKKIVLDQAFSGSDPAQSFSFYEDAYAIVVARDPRDMYIFAKKILLSKGRFMPTDTVENFIEYYRLLRSGKPYREEHDRILRLKFEDMVYNYEETAARIDRFLNVKNVRPRSVFVPEMSAANTNLIKKFPEFAEDVKKIEEALPEFLFDFDKYPPIDNGGKMFFGKSPLNKKK